MVAEAEIICEQRISVQFSVCVAAKSDSVVAAAAAAAAALPIPIASDSVSIDFSLPESAKSCPTSIQTALVESPAKRFIPNIRSGSHTDIGPRRSNEDEHIRIDDLSTHLGSLYKWSLPSSFYAVFDGHGGSDASTYVKDNAMRLFFDNSDLPQTSDINNVFLEELEISHRKAFLLADQALADECSVSEYCGTTAITALILGDHLLIANAGDCRAVLCRKGIALPLSQDHRPSYLPEQKRVEKLGGFIEYGYLNGELAVTRALGDWYMKTASSPESESPLTANPDVQQTVLTEEDEFLIIGCDGIWDVMSNEEAVRLVRRELKKHDDPQLCAKELVNQALRMDTSDNLTAIVVCFSSTDRQTDSVPCQRPRFKFCVSEEARNKLRSLMEGN